MFNRLIHKKRTRVQGDETLDPHGDHPHGLIAWVGGVEVLFDKPTKNFVSIAKFEELRKNRARERFLLYQAEQRKNSSALLSATPGHWHDFG